MQLEKSTTIRRINAIRKISDSSQSMQDWELNEDMTRHGNDPYIDLYSTVTVLIHRSVSISKPHEFVSAMLMLISN